MPWYVEEVEAKKTVERAPQLRKLVGRHGDWADLAIPDTKARYGNDRLVAVRYHYLPAAVAKDLISLLFIDRTLNEPRGAIEVRPDVQISSAVDPHKLVAAGPVVRYWLRQTATEAQQHQAADSLLDYIAKNMPGTASRHETEVEMGSVSLSGQRMQDYNVLALVDMENENQPRGLMERLEDEGPIDRFLINNRVPIALMQPGMDVHLFARRLEIEAIG